MYFQLNLSQQLVDILERSLLPSNRSTQCMEDENRFTQEMKDLAEEFNLLTLDYMLQKQEIRRKSTIYTASVQTNDIRIQEAIFRSSTIRDYCRKSGFRMQSRIIFYEGCYLYSLNELNFETQVENFSKLQAFVKLMNESYYGSYFLFRHEYNQSSKNFQYRLQYFDKYLRPKLRQFLGESIDSDSIYLNNLPKSYNLDVYIDKSQEFLKRTYDTIFRCTQELMDIYYRNIVTIILQEITSHWSSTYIWEYIKSSKQPEDEIIIQDVLFGRLKQLIFIGLPGALNSFLYRMAEQKDFSQEFGNLEWLIFPRNIFKHVCFEDNQPRTQIKDQLDRRDLLIQEYKNQVQISQINFQSLDGIDKISYKPRTQNFKQLALIALFILGLREQINEGLNIKVKYLEGKLSQICQEVQKDKQLLLNLCPSDIE